MTPSITPSPYAPTCWLCSLILSACVLLLPPACRKDEDNPWGLPEAPEVGANTFGCLLDGKPWVANIALGLFVPGLRPLDMYYDETGTGTFANNIWGMVATNQPKDTTGEFMSISAWKFTQPGKLNRSTNKVRCYIFLRAATIGGFADYYLDTLRPYRIEITKLDTVHNICAGRFEFYAVQKQLKDTIHVTEGRFDKKYDPY